MIDRLQTLMNRPIGEQERRRAMALAIVVLLAATVLFIVTKPSGQSTTSSTPISRPTTAVAPAPAVPASPAETGTLPAAPPGTPQASAQDQLSPRAAAAARTFLTGYLAYLYGHGTAGQIKGASPQLVRVLAKNTPRVPPAQQQRHPKVAELGSRERDGAILHVVAVIDDGGVARYPVGVLLVRGPAGWQVTRVLNFK